MTQWFKRLFFLILPDFLPKTIFYSVIVYILIGKPKFLKKVYNKVGQEENFKNSYLILHTILILLLITSVFLGILNTFLIIINMIPGIAI